MRSFLAGVLNSHVELNKLGARKDHKSLVAVCAKKKHHCFIAPKGRKINKGCSCHSSRALAASYIYIHFLYSTEHFFR